MTTDHSLHWSELRVSHLWNFCGTKKEVKPIWSLFTTGQTMIHYEPSAVSFETLALYDGRSPHPRVLLLLFLPSPPSLRRSGVYGTITMAHKGK